jgi:hypothetical protein
MKNYFYIDKILYNEHYDLINNITSKENLKTHFLPLKNCIKDTNNIKKMLISFYYYKHCKQNMDIKSIFNLTYKDRIFYLVSYGDKINIYYYLNIYCDTYNLLTKKQKDSSIQVNTYINLLKNISKTLGSGAYVLKSVYDNLSDNIKKKLNILDVKYGKYPMIITLK